MFCLRSLMLWVGGVKECLVERIARIGENVLSLGELAAIGDFHSVDGGTLESPFTESILEL